MKPEFVLDENLRYVPKDPLALQNYIETLKSDLKEANEPHKRVSVLGEIGVCLRCLNHFEEAEKYLLEALKITASLSLGIAKEVQQKIRLAHVWQEKKEFVQSDKLFAEVIQVCRENADANPYLDFALQHAGKNYFDQDQYRKAFDYFSEALKIRLEKKSPRDQIESTQAAIQRTLELIPKMKLKIGISACLVGMKCNFNGTDLLSQFVADLQSNSQIEMVHFCPEDSVFGTPRLNLRIVGGDGFDVLDGNAVVMNEHGLDVTEKQIQGANLFLKCLKAAEVKYAILMDGSPSCGSNVLLKEESWPAGGFKRGVGVTAALLRKNDIIVFSSFDQRSIADALGKVVEDYSAPANLKDLKDMPKFKNLFQER